MFVHMWCWFFVKLFWVRLDGFSLFKKQRNCNQLISKTFIIHLLRIKINKIHIYGNFNKKKKSSGKCYKMKEHESHSFRFLFHIHMLGKKIKPTFIGRYWYIINTGWCKFLNMNWSVLILKKVIRLIFYN